MVRSRLFCKEKTVIPRNATAGDFELRKRLFLLISEFRGAVGMLRLRLPQRSSSNGSHHKVNRFWNRYVRASCDRKHQTPSTKHQRNSKLQPPKTWEVIGWSLKIGASLGFRCWDLELNTTHLHIMMRRFVP